MGVPGPPAGGWTSAGLGWPAWALMDLHMRVLYGMDTVRVPRPLGGFAKGTVRYSTGLRDGN